jgi:hypothetical protein
MSRKNSKDRSVSFDNKDRSYSITPTGKKNETKI